MSRKINSQKKMVDTDIYSCIIPLDNIYKIAPPIAGGAVRIQYLREMGGGISLVDVIKRPAAFPPFINQQEGER